MPSRTTLLQVLASLLVGGAIGYGLAGSSPVNLPAGPDARTDDEYGTVPPGEMNSRGTPTSERPSAGTGSDRPELPPPGNGTLTGRVRTLDGRPVEGALVRASLRTSWTTPPRVAKDVPRDRDLREMADELVAAERFRRETRRDAVSGADGTYTIRGLSDAVYSVDAWKRGYALTREARKWKLRPGDGCDFVAHPQLEVSVDIVLPDGSVPAQARLRSCFGRHDTTVMWRPDDRLLLLAPGEWSIEVAAGPFYRYEGRVEATVKEGDAPRTLTVPTESRVGIHGRIFDRPPDARGPKVSIRPLAPEADPAAALKDEGRHRREIRWAQIGSANGQDVFGHFGLSDGRWLVALHLDEGVVDSAVVQIGGKAVERDLRAPPDDPAGFVRVRMEDPDGRVLQGTVTTLYEAPTGGAYGRGRFLPLEDGSYRVRHPKSEKPLPPGGRYFVEAYTPAYGRKRVPYGGPGEASVTVRFERSVWLALRLAGYEGTPYVRRTHLTLTRVEGGDRIQRATHELNRLDTRGRSKSGPHQPGRYELEVRVRTDHQYRFPVARRFVVLSDRDETVEVALPKLCRLTILEAGERKVYAVRAVGDQRTLQGRPRNGRVSFGPLPAGTYAITMGGKSMTVSLTEDSEIRFAGN